MSALPLWRPPYDFLAACPTFIDHWPQAWIALAPEFQALPLDAEHINALGCQIAGFRHWFTPAPTAPLQGLAQQLDAMIVGQQRASFVRLNSRSPKDSLYAMHHGLRVADGAQALAIIVEGSERCAADLRMALDHRRPVAIIVRRWLEFPEWAEFRCLMRKRRLVGVSQALHRQGRVFPEIARFQATIVRGIRDLMAEIIATSLIEDAVFDLAIDPRAKAPIAWLLDVNPVSSLTDTALFSDWQDYDASFRYWGETDGAIRICRHPLDANQTSP